MTPTTLALLLVFFPLIVSRKIETAAKLCNLRNGEASYQIYITLFSKNRKLISPKDRLFLEVRHRGFSWRPYGNCNLDMTYHKGFIVACKIASSDYEATNIIQLVQNRTLANGTYVVRNYPSYIKEYNCIPIGIEHQKENLTVFYSQTGATVTWQQDPKATNLKPVVFVDGKVIKRLDCACPVNNACPKYDSTHNCSINIVGLKGCFRHEVCVETCCVNNRKTYMCTVIKTLCNGTSRVQNLDGGASSTIPLLITVIILFVATIIFMMIVSSRIFTFHQHVPKAV